MLNEFLELFLGAFNYLIPPENPYRDYMSCVFLIVISCTVLLGIFLCLCVVFNGFLRIFFKRR